LSVESLERRDLLATLLWVGPANGNFNVQNNWINEANGALVAPAAGDNLDFNPNLIVVNQQGNNRQGTNTAASDNEPADFQFGNITLANAYTNTVTMLQRIFRNNTVTLAGGTLQAVAGATDTIGGTLTWNGGTLAGTWWVGNSTADPPASGTMRIQLDPQVQNPQAMRLRGPLTVDNGVVTWASGDITYNAPGTVTVNPSGTFTITGTVNLNKGFGEAVAQLNNSGTFQKTGGAVTNLAVTFVNMAPSSSLLASAGSLDVSRITQFSGEIKLSGGWLGSVSPLTLGGGTLTGVGTITANVNNGDPTGNLQGGGTIRPGLNGGGGTLTIDGDFTQTNSGTLQIDVNAGNTGLGVLNVTGSVTLGGQLYVNRNPSYTPPRNTSLTFLTYGGTRNQTDLTSWFYFNSEWTDQQGNSDKFDAQPNDAQKTYNLLVVPA
jgi:hypothetical protein